MTTTPWGDAFEGIKFEQRDVELRSETGELLFLVEGAVIPAHWSDTAAKIIVGKYFRRNGLRKNLKKISEPNVPPWLRRSSVIDPAETVFGETDARQVFHRMAGCWTYWGLKLGHINEQEARQFYVYMCQSLAKQEGAPNSPQWFNTGLHWAYGIDGPAQGHFYVDELATTVDGIAVRSGSSYERPQPHACFIQSVDDDLVGDGGIMDLWVREARLFKYGSGTGTNFSRIRAKGEPLSGGGKSSGLMSFLRVGDRAAGSIKSGGTTRRAAKMVIVDVDHPDVMDFISLKLREENKVAALVAGSRMVHAAVSAALAVKPEDRVKASRALSAKGVPSTIIDRAFALADQGMANVAGVEIFDTDYRGEAHWTVDGQNANLSIRMTDEFMTRVVEDNQWDMIGRADQKFKKTIRARELWDHASFAAWACADPGVQFHDTINTWHTCPNDGPIRGSNPCSEYMFLDDTACNLASINLTKFLMPDGSFDAERFVTACEHWTMVLEISVGMAQYPSKKIAELSHRFRTLGLGYANMGAMLMKMGVAYDSDAGRGIASMITSIMSGAAYAKSADMAEDLGPFQGFENNKAEMQRVIGMHMDAATGTAPTKRCVIYDPPSEYEYLRDVAVGLWNKAVEGAFSHGIRNAQVTVLAPTGTIGLVMDCDTTGIEPDFALVKFKSLAGGGTLRVVNSSVPAALKSLGYDDSQINDIMVHLIGRATLKGFRGIEDMGLNHAKIDAAISKSFSLSLALDESLASVLRDRGMMADAEKYAFGHGSMDSAPHLKPEHLPVFDCANSSGRCISPAGHVKMMAACQPFLSGAISKTVNMPVTATVADVSRVYRSAWEMGVKAIAVYRDRSKISQALNLAFDGGMVEPFNDEVTTVSRKRKMPRRAFGFTDRVEVGGYRMFIRTGQYEDGSLGEIFVDVNKEGATFRSLMNAFCIAVSMALQHGVPLERLVEKFTFTRFEPNGMVEGHDRIRTCTSIVDLVFRILGVHYLERDDLAHIQADEVQHYSSKTIATQFTGDVCASCGAAKMMRNGTCLVCTECGETTGCS